MPGPTFTYTGTSALGYADYRDPATGVMLVAEPGGSYLIEAIDGERPVPPTDGRWQVPSPPAKPAPLPPAPAPSPAPAADKGGE